MGPFQYAVISTGEREYFKFCGGSNNPTYNYNKDAERSIFKYAGKCGERFLNFTKN